jgi:hypothetical protein
MGDNRFLSNGSIASLTAFADQNLIFRTARIAQP